MPDGTAQKVLGFLERFDLKPDGQDQWRCNSPLRPGSNSQAFTLKIDGPENGAYYDHVSHDSGSLYDLARLFGLEISATTPPPDTKRAYAGLDDYARAHGITGDDLKQAGWGETYKDNRPALVFKTVAGMRWRFLDGQKPYYKSEKGYHACWYGLNPSFAKSVAAGKPIILCNGEISTVVGRKHGLAALCVTGGEKAIPDGLITELHNFIADLDPDLTPGIIVAFDCDVAGKRAGRIVAGQLVAAGLNARAVDLHLGGKGDLADFCMLHGRDTQQTLLDLPPLNEEHTQSPAPRRAWYIIPAQDLAKLPPITWIVPGEIPERGITVLFGASGAGKSFLALDYALKIAQHEPVLYMAGEGEYGYRQRIAAWCKHHTKTEGRLFMCIGAVQLLEEGDLQAFLDANRAISPRIVIIDTMARSMVGSDENSTRDMGMFIQACEEIKRILGCAVMVIHHTNKGGIQERGNSALRGASDAMIKVSAVDDLICVESAKTKDAQPFETRYMRLITVPVDMDGKTLESAVMVDAERVVQTDSDPLTKGQFEVLKAIADEQYGLDRAEISQLTNVPYNSLQRVLARLKALGFIQQAAKNAPYTVTDAGKARLTQTNTPDDRSDRIDQAFYKRADHLESHPRDHVDQPDHIDHTDHRYGEEPLFDLPDDDRQQYIGAIGL